jgi:hypothetical protein
MRTIPGHVASFALQRLALRTSDPHELLNWRSPLTPTAVGLNDSHDVIDKRR